MGVIGRHEMGVWARSTAVLMTALVAFPSIPWSSAGGAVNSSKNDDRKYVRACSDSVHGTLGKGWRKDSVVVGPIAFVGAQAYKDGAHADFRKRKRGYPVQKILVVVEHGRDVIVRVPRHRRKRLGLSYDRALFNRQAMPVSKADYQVRFDACRNKKENPYGRKRNTQFNGGFVVARAQCSVLNIVKRGRGRIGRAHLSFGMGRCPKD